MTAPAARLDFEHWVAQAKAAHLSQVISHRGIKLRGRVPSLSGPCPRCFGTDRFAIHTGKQVFHCRACGAKGHGAIDLVMFLDAVDFLTAVETLAGPPPRGASRTAPDSDRATKLAERARQHAAEQSRRDAEAARERARQIAKAASLWASREPITEDCPAGLYLRGRGYKGAIPATLGYLRPNGKHGPALVAPFGLTHEIDCGVIVPPTEVQGVHLTRLTLTGDKLIEPDRPTKITIGPSIGLPIVLAPINDLCGLAVTEGLEDGLTVYAATGLGVWVAGTAGRLLALAPMVPRYADCITIFGHDDAAGRKGATELADALRARGFVAEGQVLLEGFK